MVVEKENGKEKNGIIIENQKRARRKNKYNFTKGRQWLISQLCMEKSELNLLKGNTN